MTDTSSTATEATEQPVIALYHRWVKAGPPPLGASMARWWDARLAELHKAISEQPVRTTANNPATSNNTPDNPLTEVIQAAVTRYAAEQGTPTSEVHVLEALGYHAMGQGLELERLTTERNQLAATARDILDAFEAYWARASYCGPGTAAVQPEHFQAWRAALTPPAVPS